MKVVCVCVCVCVCFIFGNSSDSMEWKFFREILVVMTYFMQVENFVVNYFTQVENFLCLRFTAYSWSERTPMIFLYLYLQVTRSNPSVVFPELFTIGQNMYCNTDLYLHL